MKIVFIFLSAVLCIVSRADANLFSDPSYQAADLPNEVYEAIAGFEMEDQLKIGRLLEEVDLSDFYPVFPSMRPYSTARFLRISARLCYKDVNGPLVYEKVANGRPDLKGYFDVLMLLKIGEEAMVQRNVCFDEENRQVIWVPGA